MIGYITDIYDGDTFTCWVEPRPGLRELIKIRLLGVDTPELRGEHKEKGIISRDWVRAELAHVEHVDVKMIEQDSFGRWLCNVAYQRKEIGWHSLAEQLLKNNLAIVYGSDESFGLEDTSPIMEVPW